MQIKFGSWFHFSYHKGHRTGWYTNLQLGCLTLCFHSWLRNVKWSFLRTVGPMTLEHPIVIYKWWKFSLIHVRSRKRDTSDKRFLGAKVVPVSPKGSTLQLFRIDLPKTMDQGLCVSKGYIPPARGR